MRVLLTVIFVTFCVPVSAEMFVAAFTGDANDYEIDRSGTSVPVSRFAVLEAGDKVVVRAPQGALTLADFQGREHTLRAAETPYTVPKSQAPSWFDNALREAVRWYQGLAGELPEIRETISRGKDEPPQLLAMVPGENLVPTTTNNLRVYWCGGSPPYRLEITNNGGVVWSGWADKSPTQIAADVLTEGRYRVRLSSRAGGVEISDTRVFYLVPVDEFPEGIRRIALSPISGSTKAAFIALGLSQYPEWRFAALQYAIQATDQQLEAALLNGLSPPKL